MDTTNNAISCYKTFGHETFRQDVSVRSAGKATETDEDAFSRHLIQKPNPKILRKELDSFGMAMNINKYKFPLKKTFLNSRGRVSSSVSVKASITVEAALAVPVFFLAMVTILYLFEMAAIQTTVRAGLQYAGKKAAKEAYLTKTVLPASIEEDLVSAIGSDRLSRSIVIDGSSGISCEKSWMSPRTGIGTLKVTYRVRLPISFFGSLSRKYEVSMKIKSWVGYEKEAFGSDSQEIVYITETGLVYHRNYHCTYLDLSIHAVSAADLTNLRNASGGRYKACNRCHPSSSGQVYIANYGDSYHGNIFCSGIKRTVYSVPLSEVMGKGACTKCGQ